MESPNKPTTQACKNFESELVLYYYDELDGGDRARIKIHLESCESCGRYLKELGAILSLTLKVDDPPPAFWQNYSREMRHKLAEAREGRSWGQYLASLIRPWTIPVLATGLVAALALTFTLGKGLWRTPDRPPADPSLMEVLPMTENLEFFRTMEVLDAMELLEIMGGQKDGTA
jgi:hypothetical protein